VGDIVIKKIVRFRSWFTQIS